MKAALVLTALVAQALTVSAFAGGEGNFGEGTVGRDSIVLPSGGPACPYGFVAVYDRGLNAWTCVVAQQENSDN